MGGILFCHKRALPFDITTTDMNTISAEWMRATGSESIWSRIVTDPPGHIEIPASARPRIAVHLGRSLYLFCKRRNLTHRGWAVYGDIEVIPADTPSIWEPDRSDTAFVVAIDPSLLSATAEDFGLHAASLELLNRFQVRDSQIEYICLAVKAEIEAGYPNGRIFLEGLATSISAALIRRHSSLAGSSSHLKSPLSGRRLRQVLSFIEDHLKDDISLSDIARAADLSVSHLKTTFREATAVPVHRYVIQRRVERAKDLLREGELSIEQVARETGFAHSSHLATHVRRIFGCSPKKLRERHTYF